MPPEAPDHSAVVAEARKWLGTRWVHQGRADVGIDCAGLVIRVSQALGLAADDMQGYRRVPEGVAFLQHIRRQTVPLDAPRPGAIGVFRELQFPCHVGFFGLRDDHLSLIHSDARVGKVVEEYFVNEWPNRLIEVRGLIGLSD